MNSLLARKPAPWKKKRKGKGTYALSPIEFSELSYCEVSAIMCIAHHKCAEDIEQAIQFLKLFLDIKYAE